MRTLLSLAGGGPGEDDTVVTGAAEWLLHDNVQFPVFCCFQFLLKHLTGPWCGLVSKRGNANTENI